MAGVCTCEAWLIGNVPLDRGNAHQLIFQSQSAQLSYFLGKQVAHMVEAAYIRKTGQLSFSAEVDNVDSANYLVFKNNDFDGRYYFAYILEMDYTNSNVTNVMFEIDSFQTYMHDIEYYSSFVEYEHSASDELFEHLLVNNNLPTGPTIARMQDGWSEVAETRTLVAVSKKYSPDYKPETYGPETERQIGGSIANVFSGNAYYAFNDGQTEAIKELVKSMDEKGWGDAISNIWMVPAFTVGGAGSGSLITNLPEQTLTKSVAMNVSDIDGYVPRNKILFNYPYNYLVVSTQNGQTTELRYELFTGGSCEFLAVGTPHCPAQVRCTPRNYAGQLMAFDNSVVLSGWPVCTWTNDVYSNYVGQNFNGLMLGGAVDAIKAVAGLGMMVMAPAGAMGLMGASLMASGGIGVASDLAGLADKANRPPMSSGQTGTGALNMANNFMTFGFYPMTITAEYAKMIDDWYTCYGYPTMRYKVPNLFSRSNFNYVKTKAIHFGGSIPSEHREKISSMFNSGVTLWHNGSTMYRYDLPNEVTGNGEE